MLRRPNRRSAVFAVAAILVCPTLGSGQAGTQPVQYTSPEGVEYRSQPDTDAIKTIVSEAELRRLR